MGYEQKRVENKVLSQWKKKSIHNEIRKRKGEKFFLLDGPPYANAEPHPGHLLNRTHKDMVRRYKWMNGFSVWDQPGFDCHGLPIETAVEKKFGLKNKQDINDFGEKKFVAECKKLAKKNVDNTSEVFQKLGEWATWDNPYLTMDNQFIESVWWAFKELWKKKLVQKGEKVLHWCPRCGTALAPNYEIEYENITDDSIFVKFPVKGRDKEFLIIWTTTPWTIPYNLAVMANPDFNYVRAKKDDETWIIASDLLDRFEGLEALEEMKGEKLEGLEYWHPFFSEIPKFSNMKSKWLHKVLLSRDFVTLEEGTGLVHTAPGCGPEDYEVGKKHKLEPFNTVDQNGTLQDLGPFTGLKAREDDHLIIKSLEKKGLLAKKHKYSHEYPVCERCNTPMLFRTTEQWFLKATKAKEKMLEENKKVEWVPEWAGQKRFAKWLGNIRDWCISRQRYWGVPIPIWECEKCHKLKIVGSKKELKKKIKELHKPDIDKVKFNCSCKGKMTRVPDVLDVWVDSACAPFASMPYPKNKKRFQKLYPADLITESHDQFRGWFYSLMTINSFLFGKSPYKSVYMHGHVLNEKGEKMSKRKGNFMPVPEIMEKYGADLFRLGILNQSNPGEDLKFGENSMRDSYRVLNTLWNMNELMRRASKLHRIRPKSQESLKTEEDRWILSKINSLVFDTTEKMEDYVLSEPSKMISHFVLEDFSRWYGKLVRDRLYNRGKQEAKIVLSNMGYVMDKLLLLLAPIVPFITEELYRGGKKSIHLEKWPTADKKLIHGELEKNMELAKELLQTILSLRDKAQIGIRWPVDKVIVLAGEEYQKKINKFEKIIKRLANVEKIEFAQELPDMDMEFKFNYDNLKRYGDSISTIITKTMGSDPKSVWKRLKKGHMEVDGMRLGEKDFVFEFKSDKYEIKKQEFGIVLLDTELTPQGLEKGYVREVIRRIQSRRKKNQLRRSDFIVVRVSSDPEMEIMLEKHRQEIEKITNSRMELGKGQEEFEIKGKKFRMSVLASE